MYYKYLQGVNMNRYLFVFLIFLMSCQTNYRAKSQFDGLGYENKKISKNAYQIRYITSSTTTKSNRVKLWHRRASELCGHSKYHATVTLSRTSTRLESLPKLISSKRERDIDIRSPEREVAGITYNSESNIEHVEYRSINTSAYAPSNVKPKKRPKNITLPIAKGKVYCDGKQKLDVSSS
jgi:hypothetical protein